ncbi:peptide chain release factor 3 [Metallumcola ferriviriculae]|uniref:Peptide chain release factor 3 n=1 Tax=Metallumcola ferriviriculae TaxID=3039180 RepID=A0AAU0UM52_9FIRM|nr:peptide chain release factor 3 [Desulfitibacteraceae bacterium MK1]
MNNGQSALEASIEKRRTFAIISHPDAGKTTLTEKLLLFGGAIRLAGSVKGRKTKKYATSDWMEIEKQRGISVTSSVMQFAYKEHLINILDTPGHQDFSEDTYRTLLAADSAVMLIDAAKGVEPQTIKLFEACRLQQIPVFTFINKLDRFGKEPLDLLEEIEQVLGMRSCPLNWPIGMGYDFRGIYDRRNNQIELFKGDDEREIIPAIGSWQENTEVREFLDNTQIKQLEEEIGLLDIAGDPFDQEKIDAGKLTPVFFGSAINNFGVQTFLDQFLQLAPPPQPHKSNQGYIDPAEQGFSGFIFKIQANMDPAHRDRIAFMRICSGQFQRGMIATHARQGKKIKLSQPQQFFAQSRDIIEEACAGDIVGIYDPGIFQIGDTVYEGKPLEYEELPQFSPEYFAKVFIKEAMKQKRFYKGLKQLAEEGAVQVYKSFLNGSEDIILGVVGELQFEVFQFRLLHEYGAEVILERLPHRLARWVRGEEIKTQELKSMNSLLAKDRFGQLVVLFKNETALNWVQSKNPTLNFVTTNREPLA